MGPDGRELFYRVPPNGRVTAVTVEINPSFKAGSSKVVVEGRYAFGIQYGRNYDISPDGQRFLMIKQGAEADGTTAERQLVIVQHWFEELKARVPTGQ